MQVRERPWNRTGSWYDDGGGRPRASAPLRVGCAGWSLPRADQEAFGAGDSALQRYATRLPMVEINSSFYRPHQARTYARWAASVPEGFRFAVKLPREISHERRLRDAMQPLERFLEGVLELGEKLGPLLLQLPPSLVYDTATARAFLRGLRARRPMWRASRATRVGSRRKWMRF